MASINANEKIAAVASVRNPVLSANSGKILNHNISARQAKSAQVMVFSNAKNPK
jgi:hypothetical protein